MVRNSMVSRYIGVAVLGVLVGIVVMFIAFPKTPDIIKILSSEDQ